MQPIATDGVVWSVSLSGCHNRQPCKNVWTDRDTIHDFDSSEPKEPDPQTRRGKFEGKKGLAHVIPGHIQRLIYSIDRVKVFTSHSMQNRSFQRQYTQSNSAGSLTGTVRMLIDVY